MGAARLPLALLPASLGSFLGDSAQRTVDFVHRNDRLEDETTPIFRYETFLLAPSLVFLSVHKVADPSPKCHRRFEELGHRAAEIGLSPENGAELINRPGRGLRLDAVRLRRPYWAALQTYWRASRSK